MCETCVYNFKFFCYIQLLRHTTERTHHQKKNCSALCVCLASTKQTTSKFLIDASLWNFSFQRDCHATFAMLKSSFPSWHSELKRFISFVLFFLCYKTSVLCFLKSCCPFLLALTITRLIKRIFKQTGLKLKCFLRFIRVLMNF